MNNVLLYLAKISDRLLNRVDLFILATMYYYYKLLVGG